MYCENNIKTEDHFVVKCVRFRNERRILSEKLGKPLPIRSVDVVSHMLCSQIGWDTVCGIISYIMQKASEDEVAERPRAQSRDTAIQN